MWCPKLSINCQWSIESQTPTSLHLTQVTLNSKPRLRQFYKWSQQLIWFQNQEVVGLLVLTDLPHDDSFLHFRCSLFTFSIYFTHFHSWIWFMNIGHWGQNYCFIIFTSLQKCLRKRLEKWQIPIACDNTGKIRTFCNTIRFSHGETLGKNKALTKNQTSWRQTLNIFAYHLSAISGT